jgi:hypothetical protein
VCKLLGLLPELNVWKDDNDDMWRKKGECTQTGRYTLPFRFRFKPGFKPVFGFRAREKPKPDLRKTK